MPAYVVYRPSVMRSGRLAVRGAAVAALLAAAFIAFAVVTHSSAERSPAVAHHAAQSSSSLDALTAHVAKVPVKTSSAGLATAKTRHSTLGARPKTKPFPAKKAHTVVLSPTHTPVAVLNGGTSHGAAAALASRLRALGYPVPIVGNAGRRDLPSAVEYSDGLGAAARALAKHLGPVKYVTPFDGPQRNLGGAHLLVIVGD